MIAPFALVLADMAARGWVDLFRGYPAKGSLQLTAGDMTAVINEPTSWISEINDSEIIGLATGDEWDRLTAHSWPLFGHGTRLMRRANDAMGAVIRFSNSP